MSDVDGDRFRLRTFVESLTGSDELDVHDEPVDLAGVADVFEGNARAVWPRQIGPERQEIVGGLDASHTRLARAFGSVRAALADPPKYFAELMAEVGSRDGREIVRELNALRGERALDRDERGRYLATAR